MMNYSKQEKQLKYMLDDKSYWDYENGFKGFVTDMYVKVKNNKKLSPKQIYAVKNTIKNYAKYYLRENDPNYKSKTNILIEESLQKIKLVQKLLYECKYTRSYEYGAEDFLNSVEKQVETRGTLSDKQKQALNKMYKRFKKRSEK